MTKLIVYYFVCALGLFSFLGWGLFIAVTGVGFLTGSLSFDEARKFPLVKSLKLYEAFQRIRVNGTSFENLRLIFLSGVVYSLGLFLSAGLIYGLLFTS